MLYFVSHKYQGDTSNIDRVKRILHDLQTKHTEHCFICPLLVFSHLEYGEIGFAAEMELCLDILSACDGLIVASEISEGVQQEIDFANLVGMEVVYLAEEFGQV